MLWVDDLPSLQNLVQRLSLAQRIAVDVESNGMFTYQPELCTIQIAVDGEDPFVAIVDALRLDVSPLSAVFSASSIPKILHDATLDAQLLSRRGAPLAHVHDTEIAARFLGHTTTGLANVLSLEVGVVLSKKLQTHNWGHRPISAEAMSYLENDVAHLLRLHDILWGKADGCDIREELELECAHRIDMATKLPPELPPFARLKGFRSVPPGRSRIILRELADARERIASELDLPPGRILSRDALLAWVSQLAQGAADLRRYVSHAQARPAFAEMLANLDAAQELTPKERQLFEDATTPSPLLLERRKRAERLLSAFRTTAAQARGVSPQVVLPGHMLRMMAAVLSSADSIALVLEAVEDSTFGSKRRSLYAHGIAEVFEKLQQPSEPSAVETAGDVAMGQDGSDDGLTRAR